MNCEFCKDNFNSDTILKVHKGICAQNPSNNSIFNKLIELCRERILSKDFNCLTTVEHETNQFMYMVEISCSNDEKDYILNVKSVIVETKESGIKIDTANYFDNFERSLEYDLRRFW